MYHVSIDVLGVLIARVSGQSLGTFMRERIFDPLGMKDTAFYVPSEKIERLPGFYFFGASEWRWTFSATKFSAPQADSLGTAASAHRLTPILQRE